MMQRAMRVKCHQCGKYHNNPPNHARTQAAYEEVWGPTASLFLLSIFIFHVLGIYPRGLDP